MCLACKAKAARKKTREKATGDDESEGKGDPPKAPPGPSKRPLSDVTNEVAGKRKRSKK